MFNQYATLAGMPDWTLSLVKKNYPFNLDFVKSYYDEHIRYEEYQSVIADFLFNKHIIWDIEFILNCKWINWKLQEENELVIDIFKKNLLPQHSLIAKHCNTNADFENFITTVRSNNSLRSKINFNIPTADSLIEFLKNEPNVSYKIIAIRNINFDIAFEEIRNFHKNLKFSDFCLIQFSEKIWECTEYLFTEKFINFLFEVEEKCESYYQSEVDRRENLIDKFIQEDNEKAMFEDSDENNGYGNNEFDDETIDDAFDGDPDNVWNVD